MYTMPAQSDALKFSFRINWEFFLHVLCLSITVWFPTFKNGRDIVKYPPHPLFERNVAGKFPFFSRFVFFRGPLWVRVLECSMLSCVLSKLSAPRASTNPHRGLSICFWLTEYWPKLMSLFSKRLCLKHAICYKKLLYRLMVQLSLSNNPTTVITIMIGK